MSSPKPQRPSEDEDSIDDEGSALDEQGDAPEDGSRSESDCSSPDTADEIAGAKRAKSKKTLKRKRRATEPSHFGATLQSLLNTDAPSTAPLSLKPSIARKHNDQKLESRAKKILRVEKREKEDKGRIMDVIGGWGGESERALRKVAQRGGENLRCHSRHVLISKIVVQLFNVIQQSQAVASTAAEESKASRGKGKPSLPVPAIDKVKGKGKGKNKDNVIGRGKEGKLLPSLAIIVL
jgi:hypothetical protein